MSIFSLIAGYPRQSQSSKVVRILYITVSVKDTSHLVFLIPVAYLIWDQAASRHVHHTHPFTLQVKSLVFNAHFVFLVKIGPITSEKTNFTHFKPVRSSPFYLVRPLFIWVMNRITVLSHRYYKYRNEV